APVFRREERSRAVTAETDHVPLGNGGLGLVPPHSEWDGAAVALVAGMVVAHQSSNRWVQRDDDRLSARHCIAHSSRSRKSLLFRLGKPERVRERKYVL